jgi:polyisoprenoid-binding protein YceI
MTWEIDSTYSHVSFALRVMSIMTTRGRFKALRGQLHIDEQNPANSWIVAEVDAASVATQNTLRDAHLRSAAFFAVKQYPTITFTSTRVEHTTGQNYRVTGNLTMRGVTRLLTFEVVSSGQSSLTDAHIDLSASAMLNRNDFGIGRGPAIRAAASPMVTIEIHLVVVQQGAHMQETGVAVHEVQKERFRL